MSDSDPRPDKEPAGLTFWQVVGSTFAAAIGVQKKANKERDFTHGKPLPFIVAGLVFTALFVLAVVAVVQMVLSRAGAG
jgi:hypothetical protein